MIASTFKGRCAGLLAILCISVSPVATAQEYPTREAIRLVVAQQAGSATDQVARVVGTQMSRALGQDVVIENRPGAGGLVGAEAAARAEADGYTLFLANISTHGVNPGLYASLPYDPIADFAPIGLLAKAGNMLIVTASSPIRSVPDLVAEAKANPGVLTFATAGQGSSQHLATELFASMAGGLEMQHVPYQGGPQAVTAVMSGEAMWAMPTIPAAKVGIASGRARAVAVSTVARSRSYPDVPTVAETLPGFEVTSWYGLAAPAGTPAAVVDRVNAAARQAIQNEETVTSLNAAGLEVATSTPEEFAEFIQTEITRWRRVIADANIELEQ